MSLQWEVDYIRDERRRRLSRSQPFQWSSVDWVKVTAWVSAALLCAAFWRILYLAVTNGKWQF